MSDFQKYTAYTVEDFITDDRFFEWVKRPDEESAHFWQTFLLLYPEKEPGVREAQQFILSVNPQQKFSMAERKDLWTGIQQNIDKKQTIFHLSGGRLQRAFIWGTAAAIVGALLLFSSLFFSHYASRELTLSSVYGQKRTVLLPDGSAVILNGNSSIRYAGNFKNSSPREVWIQGEAFFMVKHLNRDPGHIKEGQRFIVHATNLNIEVLGTEFNVNTRHGDEKVSLNSGSIRLSFNDRSDTLTMKPGELVNYSKRTRQYVKATVDPHNYSSWTDNKLILNNTPFSEIIHSLDDNYGFTITLSDTTLLNEKLSGEIPVGNSDEMIRALSKALNVTISRQENNVLVIKRID